ncbi:hypothetical protein [Massilia horti]|uniref:Transmembrane protein n=1 Tax=Massilia horti TaxID=2562153 RepID=A0A4Y9T426_9BURK|nr:hypothetical protein [Massilia horti]TFW34663.1 hypothetical protein E4O92_03635 [Massilia horti]
MILTWFDRILPAQLPDGAERRAARHLALLATITAVSAPLLMVMYHLLGFDAAGLVVLCGGAVMALTPMLLRAGAPLALARDVFIGALFLLKIWLALHLGGLGSSTVPWFVLCPMVAVLIGGARPGLTWSALVLAVLVGLFFAGRAGAVETFPVADRQVLDFIGHAGLVILATIIVLCMMTRDEVSPAGRKH